MEAEKYLNDIQDIKNIMDRSSRFISLSGMAGVACGIIALVGAYLYHAEVYSALSTDLATNSAPLALKAFIIALCTLTLALGSAIVLTMRRTKRESTSLWDARTKQMLTRFSVPLVTGGLLSLIVAYHGFSFIALPITLIFYGLGAYAASRFSYKELRSLGIINIIFGLTAALFLKYALLLWALGFGLVNIVYGIAVYYKYEKKAS